MYKSAWEYSQTTLFHLQRHEILIFVIHLVQLLIFGHPIHHFRTTIQGEFMTSRNAP